MTEANGKSTGARPLTIHLGRGLREGLLLLLLATAAYLFLSLLTFNANDPGWSHVTAAQEVANAGGRVGAWFADVLLYLFGYLAYLFPVLVALLGWVVFHGPRPESGTVDMRSLGFRLAGFVATVITGCALADIHILADPEALPMSAGGVLGSVLGDGLVKMFSLMGATLFLLAFFLAGFTLFTGLSWLALSEMVGRWTLQAVGTSVALVQRLMAREASEPDFEAEPTPEPPSRPTKPRKPRRKKPKAKERVEPTVPEDPAALPAVEEKKAPDFNLESPSGGDQRPGLGLLDAPKQQDAGYSPEQIESMSRMLEEQLADFGVEVKVVDAHPGPVITRFELQPAPGVKVNQISNLSKDLARSLSMTSVRVVEVIPGKPTVGLEVPNEKREVIAFAEVLRGEKFAKARSPLTMALGKDIGGHPVVADLAKMPHLLVAGTTGSGKSVGVNAMLLSMLYKASPEELRLILIDPKMLELSVYEGIPHLLAPVVTDMKEAANALRWCVGEMERRYQLMAALGVRNIAGFNKKVREAAEKGEPIKDPTYKPEEAFDPDAPHPELEPLPYIVVTVDEFADMMMVVGKKVEELIARLAQKARAAGIHLILATQRPSVDVITGLIKANIPSRIGFQVSSRVDSRTVLDQMGAEQLLGNGDMLYLPPGTSMPERVHGAFVADHEVHKVVEQLKATGEPDYVEEVLAEQGTVTLPGERPTSGDTGEELDELYDQAVKIVTESRKASISYVQRRLKIGYNRAARMVEEMEAAGVVGPLQNNGQREVIAPPPPKD